ncbi:MAG TPA: hypothetical protein PKD79_02600 [Candidatus Doudnabacteria bacterium]|nr:hypothetical protein [Candidatus Doudnabacteria bacterium]
MINYKKSIIALLIFSLAGVILVPVVIEAQGPLAPGAVVIELRKNGARTSERTIPVEAVQEYSLYMAARAQTASVSTNNFWEGKVNIFRASDSTVSQSDLFGRETIAPGAIVDKTHQFRAGSATPGLYSYVVRNCSQPNTTLCPKAELQIQFTGALPEQTPPFNPTEPESPTPSPQAPDDTGVLTINRPSSYSDLPGFFSRVINWLLMIIAMIASIMIIYSGIMLIFNGGNETRVAKAKSTLTWAVVGLIVTIGAIALVSIIQGLL